MKQDMIRWWVGFGIGLISLGLLGNTGCGGEPTPKVSSPTVSNPPSGNQGKETPTPQPPPAKEPQPLSPSSFVYLSTLASGDVTIRSFDLEEGTSALISDLDSSQGKGSPQAQIALSPDKKRLAFAAKFRTEKADIHSTEVTLASVWSLYLDGSDLRRLSEPLPYREAVGENWSAHLALKSWGGSEGLLYGLYSEFWKSGGSLAGGASVFTLHPQGGLIQILTLDAACGSIYSVQAHPTSSLLLYRCDPHDHPKILDTATRKQEIVRLPSGLSGIPQVQWSRDGRAIFLLAKMGWRYPDQTTRQQEGILRYERSTQTWSDLLAPVDPDHSIDSFSVSDDESSILVTLRYADSSGSDILWVDRKENQVYQLTEDRRSFSPTW